MSHLTYCRLAVISIGILSLNQIAIDPTTAAPRVALVDRITPQSSRLNIGLQPIIQDADRSSDNRRSSDNSNNSVPPSADSDVLANVGGFVEKTSILQAWVTLYGIYDI